MPVYRFRWLSTLFKIKAYSLLDTLIMKIIYDSLASFRSRILDLSLSLSHTLCLSYMRHFSYRDILPRTTSPKRIFSKWITGLLRSLLHRCERKKSTPSPFFSYKTRETSPYFHIYHFIYSNRKNIFYHI